MNRSFVIFLFLMFLRLSAQNIVPLPYKMEVKNGNFIIDSSTVLMYPSDHLELFNKAIYFSEEIKKISGISLQHKTFEGAFSKNTKNPEKAIIISFDDSATADKQGYRLNVSSNTIEMTSGSSTGIFYAMQTLFQMLPQVKTNEILKIPQIEITDYPQFLWRGLMVDTVRHFYSVDALKQIIEWMSMLKLNVFHWHLCDDQGWRLQIKKYPELTEKGAWRHEREGSVFYKKDSLYIKDILSKPTFIYGGYYTQEDVIEIVRFANLRGVSVVPEIEMPGHSGAVISVFPELSCTKAYQQVPTILDSSDFSKFSSNFCPATDQVFQFLKDVIDEVVSLFPSSYIHIGGDEVNLTQWKNCSACQNLIKSEHLASEHDLQGYFIKKIQEYVISKGRNIIGWDEILQDDLHHLSVIMSWRGKNAGILAANQHRYVVMTPNDPLYFNRYQTEDMISEPLSSKYSINTLEKVYEYNPTEGVLPENQKYILGAQAALWTEYISSLNLLQYMLFPRLIALSEALWSFNQRKDYSDFKLRMKPILKGFDQKGIYYFKKYN